MINRRCNSLPYSDEFVVDKRYHLFLKREPSLMIYDLRTAKEVHAMPLNHVRDLICLECLRPLTIAAKTCGYVIGIQCTKCGHKFYPCP